MLDFAINYEEQLQPILRKTTADPKNRYWNPGLYNDLVLELEKNTWNKLQMVSVDDKGNIKGYLKASFHQDIRAAVGLQVINLGTPLNRTFSKDFNTFIDNLFFMYGMNKINFAVLIGNPAEKMYDKFIKKYGGCVVGIHKDDNILLDGTLCDSKSYEIMRREYKQSRRNI